MSIENTNEFDLSVSYFTRFNEVAAKYWALTRELINTYGPDALTQEVSRKLWRDAGFKFETNEPLDQQHTQNSTQTS